MFRDPKMLVGGATVDFLVSVCVYYVCNWLMILLTRVML